MKPYTEKATCPKCATTWGAKPTYCDGGRCKRMRHGSEHLHCRCKSCKYEWLMECADAEPSPEEATIYSPIDIDCPHCTERVELAVTTPTRAFHSIVVVVARPDNYYDDSMKGCTCDSAIASIQGLHLKDCPVYNTKKEQDDPTEGCTCVGGDWHFEDCPQYQP